MKKAAFSMKKPPFLFYVLRGVVFLSAG